MKLKKLLKYLFNMYKIVIICLYDLSEFLHDTYKVFL